MAYATIEEVEAGFRPLSGEEKQLCAAQLEEAAALIDAYRPQAEPGRKRLVCCRMVRRLLDGGGQAAPLYPTGATQGSASALGYSQSWVMSGGSVGELYLSKLEKKLLGSGNRIGTAGALAARLEPARGEAGS